MQEQGRSSPPRAERGLVRAAGWIVPGPVRAEWRERWTTLLASAWVLFERGELRRRDLIACARSCAADAWGRSRYSPRSPRFVLATAATALLVLGILTHGFAATRRLFEPLPVKETNRLVSIRYTGSINQPAGVPPRLLPVWAANSPSLEAIAGFWHRPYAANASVTPNFFALLGTNAIGGRLFRAGDRDVAVVSRPAWRAAVGKEAPALGTRIRLQGRSYTLVGFLPDSFWAISPRIAVWTPLVLQPQPDPGVPPLIGAIGRLKTGSRSTQQMEALRTELFDSAKAAHQFLPRRPEVVAFTGVPGPLLLLYLFGIAFAIGVALVLIARQQGLRLHHGARYRRFLFAKTFLLTALASLAWIESGLTGAAFTLLFLGAIVLVFWWSFADQRQRCPECLERLAMPVTIGSWSSVLDPVTTEFLCEAGHGSLCVPETEHSEPDRWRALDPSWRELFEKVTPQK